VADVAKGCTAACWSVKLICSKTLHTHTDACKDDKGRNKCGMFQHPQHDLWNECGKSVKTCGH
jgi:hypothetical protein